MRADNLEIPRLNVNFHCLRKFCVYDGFQNNNTFFTNTDLNIQILNAKNKLAYT